MIETELLICGAGPAGLGAAWRLSELFQTASQSADWLLVEASAKAGGMAISEQQDGFTWDLGGHVLFPHYQYFDDVLDKVVPEWVEVKPVRGAWMFDQFIPYPVQRNIRYFPDEVLDECLHGLSTIKNDPPDAQNFEQYLKASFGEGLYQHFFEALNLKMWGTHPGKMDASWTQHRSGSKTSNVPSVDLQRITDNINNKQDDLAWTEDTRIRYPSFGGTGAVWSGVAARLPEERLAFNRKIVAVNTKDRVATFSDGGQARYDNLFTSMPLDRLLSCLEDKPELSELAKQFSPAVVDVVGIGISGECPDELKGICSVYTPVETIAFWRASILSNFSATMAPDNAWSILCEINSGPDRPAVSDPVSAVIEGLEQLGFASSGQIISQWHRHLPYGYPVPCRERDILLKEIQQELEACGISSRGRFGGWKYEVCNQDHAFMQGVEFVDSITAGVAEVTYPTPHLLGEKRS